MSDQSNNVKHCYFHQGQFQFRSKKEFIQRYQDKGVIKRGGQAYIRRAFDNVNGRKVALKIYKKRELNQYSY